MAKMTATLMAESASGKTRGRLFATILTCLMALLLLACLGGCSQASQTPNQGPGQSSENAPLTQEEKDALLETAIAWCADKYDMTATPQNSEYVSEGFPNEGVNFYYAPTDGFEGTHVYLEADGRSFEVDVVDGVVKRDSFQSLEIYEALEEYAWQAAGLPAAESSWASNAPKAWTTRFDGSNIDVLAKEASGMNCSVLLSQDPGSIKTLPEGFSQIVVLVAQDVEDEVWQAPFTGGAWQTDPELTAPYLKAAYFANRQADGSVSYVDQPVGESVCYYGSELMGKTFSVEGDAQSLVGLRLECSANAPAFGSTGLVGLFISADQWEELTKGYTSVGYEISHIGPEGIKPMGGFEREIVSNSKNTGVAVWGDYHVVLLTPGSTAEFFGTPI